MVALSDPPSIFLLFNVTSADAVFALSSAVISPTTRFSLRKSSVTLPELSSMLKIFVLLLIISWTKPSFDNFEGLTFLLFASTLKVGCLNETL